MEDEIVDLIGQHKWVALAAVLIGLLVRLVKSDVPIPVNIPARWRPVLALALGFVSGGLQAVATGTPVREALIGGLVSGTIAILGHDVVIEALRGGRELGTAKRTPTPPTLPVLLVLVLHVVGCAPAATPEAAGAAYQAELLACVEQSATREASDVCRAKVNDRWGRAADGGPLLDGGVQ